MERVRQRFKDKEVDDAFRQVSDNALGNPIMLESEPTAADLKANTIAKVKGETGYVYMKFSDNKVVKIPVSEVT